MCPTCIIPPLSLNMASFQEVQTCVILSQEAWTVLILLSGILVCVDLALEEAWNQDAALTAQPAHSLPDSCFSEFASCPPSCWPCSSVQRSLILPFFLGNFPSPGAIHKVFQKKVFIPDFSSNISAWSRCFDYLRAFYKGTGRKASCDTTVAWWGRILWWFRLEAGSSVHIMVTQCYLLCRTVFLCKIEWRLFT